MDILLFLNLKQIKNELCLIVIHVLKWLANCKFAYRKVKDILVGPLVDRVPKCTKVTKFLKSSRTN